MDERRAVAVEPGMPSSGAEPRRGTPIWIQLLVSLLILAAAFAAWAYLYPGAREILAERGIVLPGAIAAEPAGQSGPAAGGPPGGGAAQRAGGPPGGGGFQRGGNRSAVVVTAPVTTELINDRLTAIGEGTAARSVTVISAASGTLTEVVVTPGQVVRAGDVIAQLDSQTEQIALDRARLAADDAAAALERATDLRRANSVSDVQVTAAQLANDQAQLELRNAELALDRRRIATPIDGTVGLLQVTAGNLVNAQTPITTVEDASAILINFWVPERYVGGIEVGMPITANAAALPGSAFEGTVSAVDNRIDPASRTLQVQARIPNPDGAMRPGMSFSVTLRFSGQEYAAVDPLSIQWSSEGAYVWKVVEGKAQRAMVTIVQRSSAGVLVTGDVAVGDAIVTQGILQLQEGSEVRLLDAPAEPPATGGETPRRRNNETGAAPQQGQGGASAQPGMPGASQL